VNDALAIHPLRARPRQCRLRAKDADSFVQQLRLASQAQRAAGSTRRSRVLSPAAGDAAYHAEVHSNLGVALRLIGKLEASVAHHRLSLAPIPKNPARFNLGNALRAAPTRRRRSITSSRCSAVITAKASSKLAPLATAISRSTGGRLPRPGAGAQSRQSPPAELAIPSDAQRARGGFAAYERASACPDSDVDFAQPAWDGRPIDGKRILLYRARAGRRAAVRAVCPRG
jgi:hypothetical protein